MRRVLRNARVLEGGSIYEAEVVIDDDKIRSIVRSYRGPYDEEIDLKGSILIPGLLDPFVFLDDLESLTLLPAAGITQALIALEDESKKTFKKLLRESPIDIGFRTRNPYIPPREVFGYLADERVMRLVREFYGPAYVAILARGDYRHRLRIAKKYAHKTFLIDPPSLTKEASCLVSWARRCV